MKIEYPLMPNFTDRLKNYVNFQTNWQYSYERLQQLNKECNTAFNGNLTFSVVVAGSYGRMEASSESDLDYIILTDSDESVSEYTKVLRDICSKLNIKFPNEDGVFSQSLKKSDLIDNIGDKNDDIVKLAQRLLMLMECRPIYNEELFEKCVDEILRKYLDYIIKDPTKEAIFLMNDLIRYFRSIAVNYQFNFWRNNEKWPIRNVKLRHSRVLIYAGLLLLIGNASKLRTGKFEYIKEHIKLTPIEKVVHVYLDNKDYNFSRILGAYDIFLGKLNDPSIREALQVEYENRYTNIHYAELKVTSDSFITELTRFIFSLRSTWSEEIFEYLIF